MKYFTPALYEKLQNCMSAAEFRSANAEWERAVAAYGRQLQRLEPHLSAGLRRFVRHGSLHDARVLDVGVSHSKATLVLQEEPTRGLLVLTYTLVEPPAIDANALPVEHRTPHADWLYDEIEIDPKSAGDSKRPVRWDPKAARRGRAGIGTRRPLFRHSILLSNGCEIRLRFHRLAFARSESLLNSAESRPRTNQPRPVSA